MAQRVSPAQEPRVDRAVGRERYLARLLRLIERQKSYPGAARRRNLEGRVEVSFTISCSGAVTDLQVAGGHGMLRKSARRAVQRALPLPAPPSGVKCPTRVRYRMLFELH
ncbi:MAG TPA: energy transducer TonB [Sedimenticola thiotaurini]|uniref:Protein TonB n=1 Tax=Sedimenticola thiotaurini TaxID=1543721 RepID=A0A831RII6_9GAMM|nr:energy transducer TonB [Sedimenticola thiotaurini]